MFLSGVIMEHTRRYVRSGMKSCGIRQGSWRQLCEMRFILVSAAGGGISK